MPTFLVIGAGKSGTTSLQHYLSQHPAVFMPKVKEPNFFALEGATKITGYDESDPHGFHHYPWSVTSLAAYQALFEGSTTAKARGEASTMYLYRKGAAENIKKHVNDVRLIVILRQPAERLYSRYTHLLREGRTPTAHFEDCLTRGNLWWQKSDLVQEGFYYKHLAPYFQLFSPAQIKVFLFEDLKINRAETIRAMYKHIGVDQDFKPVMDIEFNPSGRIKNQHLDKLIGQKSIVKAAFQKLSPALVEKVKQSHFAQRALVNMRKRNMEKLPLSNELKSRITNEIYKSDITQLARLINRDLSHWL